MKFEPKTYRAFALDEHMEALDFLRLANRENQLGDIENMEDVIDVLDLVGHVEYLEGILKSYNIDF